MLQDQTTQAAGQPPGPPFGSPGGAQPPGGGFGAPGGGPPPAGGFGAPPPGGFGQPPGAFGQPSGGFGQPPGGFGQPMGHPTETINTTFPVVLGFFATLCACLPGGMAAIALAMMAKDKERRGDIQGAKSQIMYSYIASIASLVIGIPLVILYVFLQVAVR